MHHPTTASGGRRSDFVREFRTGLCLPALLALLGLMPAGGNASELAAVASKSLPTAADQRLHSAIASHKGRPVLISFWATWCAPCREEMPSLQRLAKRWQDRGLAVVTVAVADNSKQVDDYLWDIGVELPVLHDPAQTLNRPWGARVIPTTVILDHRHRIRLHGQGAIDWDAPAVDQQLQSLFKTPRS